ncbi:hypothetical protein D0Z00_001607 [Geotrichum galactomycetum]|uniref:Uncharacterized protein n=1 Tax=Geotrichum galactomycetum TaxID=27317 RepID=A0ACB6V6P6_9ASCO|nr:hypothetical protein D0Z00_001607 [Geotrichum candidum]
MATILLAQFELPENVPLLTKADLAAGAADDVYDDLFTDDHAEQIAAELEQSLLTQFDGLISQQTQFDYVSLGEKLELAPSEAALLDTIQHNGIISSSVLEKLWVIREGLREVETLVGLGEFDSSLTSIEQVRHRLETFEAESGWVRGEPRPRLIKALHRHIDDETDRIKQTILTAWGHAIRYEKGDKESTLSIGTNIEIDGNIIDFGTLLEAVLRLDTELRSVPPNKRIIAGEPRVESFVEFVNDDLLVPILELKAELVESTPETGLVLRQLTSGTLSPGPQAFFTVIDQLTMLVNYLSTHLQQIDELYSLILKRISTRLVSTLCNSTLRNVLPNDESELEEFKKGFAGLEILESTLESSGWKEPRELSQWVANFPSEWITHRKVIYMDKIRSYLLEQSTEHVKLHRVPFPQFGADDNDFNPSAKKVASKQEAPVAEAEQETDNWDNEWNEDDDGWNLNDDADIVLSDKEPELDQQTEEDWGWGEEDEEKPGPGPSKLVSSKTVEAPSKTKTTIDDLVERERQNAMLCTTTEFPRIISDIIKDFVNEYKAQVPTSSSNTAALAKHVSDLLGLFRALSSLGYKSIPSKFIIHNDLTLLIDFLDNEVLEFSTKFFDIERTKLVTGCNQSLTAELIKWQERLDEILQKSNGFRDCSSEANLFVCQATIERSINLFHELSDELTEFTSFPQRVKSVGTLFEYLCTTLIQNIEDLDSISEEESLELAKLLKVIEQLEDLFADPTNPSGSARDLALYYTPSLIKCQYLAEILQSRLAEILHLYKNYSLVDFTVQELVKLINALFAPSEHRRKAIDDIYSFA